MTRKHRIAIGLIAFACGFYVAIVLFAGWAWEWI